MIFSISFVDIVFFRESLPQRFGELVPEAKFEELVVAVELGDTTLEGSDVVVPVLPLPTIPVVVPLSSIVVVAVLAVVLFAISVVVI